MRNSGSISIMGAFAVVLFFACSLSLAHDHDPASMQANIRWEVNDAFGFRIWIANLSGQTDLIEQTQRVFVYLESTHFNEGDLKRVFIGLAALHNGTKDLSVVALSDKRALERRISARPSMLHFTLEETEKAAHKENRLGDGVLEAFYWRRNQEEKFSYTPRFDSAATVTITLRSKQISYSGDIDADLVLAAREDDYGKLQDLLAQGGDVNARDKDGTTVLMIAVSRRQDAVAAELLARGADPNAKTFRGRTALMNAVTKKDTETIRLLVSRGAQINAKNADGESALMLASVYGCHDIARFLLAEGAEVNMQDTTGETALMKAVANADLALAELLVSAGAKVHFSNMKGQTAIMIAEEKKTSIHNIVRIVEEYELPVRNERAHSGVQKMYDLLRQCENMIELLKRGQSGVNKS